MAFEELKESIDQVRQEGKAYVDSTISYYKLWGFKVAMKSTTLVFKFVLIALCLLMVLLFASIAAALVIGEALGSAALGFLIVAGVYLILTGLLFLIRSTSMEGTILRKFSAIFFND